MLNKPALKAELADIGRCGFNGTIVISHKGERTVECFGYANREDNVASSARVLYDIGSLTKQFTSAAILHLQMQGKLSVNNFLAEYMPNFSDDSATITLHHLLTHTAGLPHDLGRDYDPIDRDTYLDLAAAVVLSSKPGDVFSYSNVGYSLLAAVVEIVSGVGYEQYLRTNLFEPAGMRETGYVLPNRDILPIALGYANRNILGYSYKKVLGRPDDQPWALDGPYWHLRGNGGILSSANDMLRWHKALIGTDALDAHSKCLLYGHHIRTSSQREVFYGYGWDIEPNEWNTLLVSHNGSNGIFYTDFLRFLDKDIAIFIATNSLRKRGFIQTNSFRKCDRGVAERIVDAMFNPSPKRPPLWSVTVGSTTVNFGGD